MKSVVIRAEGAVDAISFTYAGVDGASPTAGPWGGSGGRRHEVKLGEAEVVTEISGTHGRFGDHAVVRSLTLVTSAGAKHGPFGRREGTPFRLPLKDGARVVGFFGRSGRLLDALGVYVIKFGEMVVVTEVSGTYGPFDGQAGVVRSLAFVTNVGKHRPGEGAPFRVPVQDGGRPWVSTSTREMRCSLADRRRTSACMHFY
ncbi:hypothetical protein U9M48_041893 [Paspalum notatum var. saurae]|uniref:Jacalin-type lectin domain-containing protein n=1 Tax=Paspalum notatum var. saurae TaxID=547442 RepID=A0AAQ3UU71_PASNO